MTILKTAIVLAFVGLSTVRIASAGDELYRCSDGTFTNRVDRQCTPYEAKGTVTVQGAGDSAKKPFAEVKLSENRGTHRGH